MSQRGRNWILLLLTAGLALSFSLAQDDCNDVWPHALHGRILWETGRAPLFSDYATVSTENVATRDNPAMELLLYGLHSLFGYSGFLIYKAFFILTACLFAALWLRGEKLGMPAVSLAIMGMLFVAEERFFPRADLANFAFAAIFLCVLRKYELRGGRGVWFLPFLLGIWIQCHAFASVGIFLVAGFWLVEQIRRWQGAQPSGPGLGRVLAACGIVAAVLEWNDPKLLKPFECFFGGAQAWRLTQTVESAPIFGAAPDFYDPMLIWKFLIPLILIAFFFPWKRPGAWWSLLLVVVFAAAATAKFRRLLAIHALVSVPVAAIFVVNAWKSGREGKPANDFLAGGLAAFFAACMMALLWSGAYYKWQNDLRLCRPVVSPVLRIVHGVDFIRAHEIPGNVYANYSQGGYAAFCLYPFNRVHIHSLCFWYSARHLDENDRLWSGRMDVREFARKHDLAVFLLRHVENRDGAIYDQLRTLRDWPLVYLDETTAVCVRREIAEKKGLEPVNVSRITVDRTSVLCSHGYFWHGNFLMRHQAWDQARIFYERAAEAGVAVPHVWNNLGVIASRQGRFREAAGCFMLSLDYGGNNEARDNLRRLLARFPDATDPVFSRARKRLE
ncbi:MAG: hypothetical protein PHV34_19755 [Verrucomicrobiae bacterium]|nr:hypothetical protein [Verrucomicrobiae bacterium]